MIIPHSHASVPTGVVFSKEACLSGFPSGLADQLWGSGILAQEQILFFPCQGRDCSKDEIMLPLPPAVAGLLQCRNSPTHSAIVQH